MGAGGEGGGELVRFGNGQGGERGGCGFWTGSGVEGFGKRRWRGMGADVLTVNVTF